MDHLSLFSGIGGADLAFESGAGATTVGFSEIDPKASDLLGKHWPKTPNLGDIRGIDGKNFEGINIITGGFPCQDVSIAGRRAGLAGERSGLFWEFVRIAKSARPEWIVLENVSGLLSSGGRRDLGAIIGTLVELGYSVGWRVLNAQYFGVPQRRRRIFIVGYLGDIKRPGEVLFEQGSLSRSFESGRKARKNSSGESGKSLETSGVTNALTVRYGGSGGIGDVNDAQGELLIPVGTHQENLAGSLGAHISGGHRIDLDNAGAYVVRMREGKPGGGKGPLISEGTSLTLATGNDQTVFQPLIRGDIEKDITLAVRKLMPIECERLQGFPEGWTEGFTDTVRYRMLGNAICVPVMTWIAKRIAD